jgi:serine/threonine-protein kinase RsbW
VKTNQTYSLVVKASTIHLGEVRDFVGNIADEYGFSKKETEDIRLAVDEAYTNIIKHAYKYDDKKEVEIELLVDGDKFCVSLFDQGKTFNPKNYMMPDVREQIRKKKRGGMGVYLIHKLMDKVEYISEDNSNEIRMCKIKS